MKQCRQCRRTYDDSLSFCLDDGSPLFSAADSDPTLVSPKFASPSFLPGTIQTSPVAQGSSRGVLLAAIVLLAVILGAGGVVLLYRLNKWDSPTERSTSPSSPTQERRSSASPRTSPSVEPSPAEVQNLAGEWSMVNTIENTSYPRYLNLRLGYRLLISQSGSQFTGEGTKVSENGQDMNVAEQTPIHITGSIDQDAIRASFVEEGLRRSTTGRFVWTLAQNGNQLRGTFVSAAAKSSGSSVVTRER